MRNFLFTCIFLVALGLGGVIAYAVLSVNPAIKDAVEFAGPHVLEVPLSLDEPDLSIFSGEGELRGLHVGNPEGFQSAMSLDLDVVRLVVDTTSFAGNTILVREAVFRNAAVTYERGPSVSNFEALLANANRALANQRRAASSETAEGGYPGGEQKIIIDELVVAAGTVTLAVTGVGGAVSTAPLPGFRLIGIGRNEGGIPLAKALATVVDALGRTAAQAVGETFGTAPAVQGQGAADAAVPAVQSQGGALPEAPAGGVSQAPPVQ